MYAEPNVVFPKQLLEKMTLDTTIFSPTNEIFAVSALTEEVGSTLILRLYQLALDEDRIYRPVQELAAFSFRNRLELDDFLGRLPEISGLEMLMLLNPIPDGSTFI
ncbi:hypothetical protein [Oceanobacillus rekensis]|uniref:hypothetical protein n=1 Tax=Oceanobacillus rekensis TaxID=937927 RepID=UPI000B43BF2C|nr:hypothetical protein [Oceanobacillus rekensis]